MRLSGDIQVLQGEYTKDVTGLQGSIKICETVELSGRNR